MLTTICTTNWKTKVDGLPTTTNRQPLVIITITKGLIRYLSYRPKTRCYPSNYIRGLLPQAQISVNSILFNPDIINNPIGIYILKNMGVICIT